MPNYIANVKPVGDVILLVPKGKHNLKVLKEDTDYIVNIEKLTKNKTRTIAQNRYMWKIVNEICLKEDGNTSRNYETYNNILQSAGTPYEDFYIDEIAVERFKALYHHCKEVERVLINGTPKVHIWAFKGISEMDTSEATKLIDKVKEYAHQVGVKFDEDYWRNLWKTN